uniref:Ribonuclease H-like domain-containing protein n=1 Tax=Tanacetum cinerariifolium TaxID=118510 RepID=A0A6L2KSX0_TANCI|nr:ribonuclease H-like domain-containing protein [Tanacetum cinerariifolium]
MAGYDNHDGDHPETTNTSSPVPPPTQQIPHTISSIKPPILKKEEYNIWAMKIEYYLSHTYYPIWKVIQNGNGPVSVTTDTNGMIKVLPPKTTEEVVARERERKARTNLLMALPEYHLEKFHKIADAKEMWEAIKSRFQTLLSQLEIYGAGVSHEDANQKFLRSLPSFWSQVALIMRTKSGLDNLSFDDLYNNLRVFERDVKGTTASSLNTQNVAFVSSDNTSSTNDVSTACSVSSPSVLKSQKKGSSSYTDEVIMISIRIKKFHKRTGRKLQFDTKDPVGFDKTKVECFNCHKIRHFARDCKAKENQDSRRRDDGYNENKTRDNGRRPAYQDDSKALVTIDGEDIDWSGHTSDLEDTSINDRYVNGMYAVPPPITENYMPSGPDIEIDYSKFTYGPKQTLVDESDSKPSEHASCESDSSVETSTSMPEPAENAPKVVDPLTPADL